jgi:hypothetical protein
MNVVVHAWLAAVLLCAGCAAIAGLDEQYVLGGGTGGSGAGTSIGGSGAAAGGTSGSTSIGGTGTAGAAATGGMGGSTVAGGTGGTTAGGSGGEAGTGGGPLELCLNGIDDDGDDAADCDDPDCVDVQCVPAYGGGADYAFVVASPADCAAGSTPTTFDGCDGCSCAASPSCSMVVSFFLDGACSSFYTEKYGPGCYTVGTQTQNRWIRASVTPTGSCQAPPNYAPVPTTTCVADHVGFCTGSNVCVPANGAPLRTCVVVPGAVTCAAPYEQGRRYFDGALDSCTCACSKQGEGCAVGDITVYHQHDACGSGTTTAVPFDGNCDSAGWTRSYSIPSVVPSLACTGEPAPATAASEFTLCCTQ